MNEQDPLIQRLADANPVPPQAIEGAGTSADADRVLARLEEGGWQSSSGRGLRGRRRVAAAAAVLVALAAAALVLRAATQAPATAAELLRETSASAAAQPPPSDSGRYVYSKIKMEQPVTSGEDGEVWTALVTTVEETWIAPDGSGRIRSESGGVRFLGARDRERWVEDGSPPIEAGEFDMIFVAGDLVYEDVRSLPTDPAPLLEALREQVAEEQLPAEVAVFQRIAELLAAGDAPPELRASLYEVAAGLPGIQLVGDMIDPVGRSGTGVAIDYSESGSRVRVVMVLDESSSRLLALEQILLEEATWVDARPATRIAYTAYLSSGRTSSTDGSLV